MSSASPVRLAYNEYDPVDGVDSSLSPVLFLHGIGASKENWGDIPQNVADATRRKAFAIDARNHGDSEWSEAFSFDLNACDVLHFMETKNINKAILVGHSMGGITSIKATLMQPRKIEKLIVEDMYVKTLPEGIKNAVASYFVNAMKANEAAPANLCEEEWKTFIMDYIHSCLPPEVQAMRKGDRESEDNHILICKTDENGRLQFKANLKVIEKSLHLDSLSSQPVGKYEGPTCFIYGALSPFKVDEEEEHIKEYFPNSVFKGIEAATHTVHGDCPNEFSEALLKFIA